MNITRVTATGFRNLDQLELNLCDQANIIYGDNGQGKTNLVEALWLFTGAKSFRGARDKELIRLGGQRASVSISFFADGREQEAAMEIEGRRTVTLNGIPLRSPSELSGHFCAVVFSPAHLSLVRDGPREKRRFIDTSICQMKPKYIHVLACYNRALEQRNSLLKDMAGSHALYETLDIWDARLAHFAAVLIKTRATFLDRLKPAAQEVYAGISREKESFDFSYDCSLGCDYGGEIPSIELQAQEGLRRARAEDIKMRVTNYGPHRDGINLLVGGMDARVYASQGQQRSTVLALKLAECQLIYETIGEYPVILLDDVMSELDVSRRDYLLNRLRGRQIIMTCCDKAYFKTLGHGISAKMAGGHIIYSRNY